MQKPTKRAFLISSTAHAAGLLGLAAAGLLSNCAEKEPEIHVFQLVSPPLPSPAVVPPAPVKPPPKKTTPPRKKTPPPPKKTVSKKPTPRPVPKKPEPPLRKVSFTEYSKTHPPKKRSPNQVSALPVVRTPAFDPKQFQVDVKIPPIRVVGNVSSRDPDALSRYLGRVKALIEQEWRRLKADTSLRSGNLIVETKVEFRIGSSGDLRFPRLAHASSYGEFDRLVLRAVRSVGRVGAPPFPIDAPLQMTFRLN